MAETLSVKKPDVKQYKKKMDSQIKNYLELRDQIRKFKFTAADKSQKKLKHSNTEAKNLPSLKNADEESNKNNKSNFACYHRKLEVKQKS